MEALERLQSVNTTLRLMRENALCSCTSYDGSTADLAAGLAADRFLADFFIFLAQRSANAEEIREKCEVLVKTLPKVSSTFLQALAAENCTQENLHGSQLRVLTRPPQAVYEQRLLITHSAPLVGLRAMERASTTLEDFCRSYFMFHGMDVHNPQQLFKYLPVLSFVEAFLYQLDEENEEQIRAQNSGTGAFLSPSTKHDSQADAQALGDGGTQDGTRSKTCTGEQYCVRDFSSVNGLGTHAFEGLRRALADKGLLTERINSELRDGMKYWRLEYALCEAVTNGAHIAAEDVITAIKLKSFDYRVLNLLLYSLTGREVNEAHFNFLAVSELLVEISDDLYDYEDDVVSNSFNVLRMLGKVYGPTRAPEILAKLISEQEVTYQQQLDGLEPSIAKRYEERCKEATHEGGGGSKYQFGSWTVPPVIVDEEGFRTQIHEASPP